MSSAYPSPSRRARPAPRRAIPPRSSPSARPAARFIRIRSSIDATRTVIPSTTSYVRSARRSANPSSPTACPGCRAARRGAEREVVARAQRSGIQQERHVRRGTAEVIAEGRKRLRAARGWRRPARTDVDAAGDHRRPGGLLRTADQHERRRARAVRPERATVERDLAHRRTARSHVRARLDDRQQTRSATGSGSRSRIRVRSAVPCRTTNDVLAAGAQDSVQGVVRHRRVALAQEASRLRPSAGARAAEPRSRWDEPGLEPGLEHDRDAHPQAASSRRGYRPEGPRVRLDPSDRRLRHVRPAGERALRQPACWRASRRSAGIHPG